jgi:hypothetical protein
MKAFKSCTNKAFLENKENGIKQMEAAGETCGEFTSAEVTKPAGCSIKGGAIGGNEALFDGTFTVRMLPGEEENPVALTTTAT